MDNQIEQKQNRRNAFIPALIPILLVTGLTVATYTYYHTRPVTKPINPTATVKSPSSLEPQASGVAGSQQSSIAITPSSPIPEGATVARSALVTPNYKYVLTTGKCAPVYQDVTGTEPVGCVPTGIMFQVFETQDTRTHIVYDYPGNRYEMWIDSRFLVDRSQLPEPKEKKYEGTQTDQNQNSKF